MLIVMNNKYIKPSLLKKGDTIEIIAPAGVISDKTPIFRGKEYLENQGYKVILSEHLFNSHKYLSDTDENRLDDLHSAFEDKNVDGIICARGGYGSLRLINKIDYSLIKNNPKLFCGYSDITVLSLMFLKKSNLITYSSPMIKGDFGSEDRSEFTMNNFFDTVTKQENQIIKSTNLYKTGNTKGILWGGNLSSVISLCGTDFIPDEDFIFFSEDINEPAYKIDKMFTQLLNIPKFKKHLKGIILGDFIGNGYPEQLDELFTDISEELSIPILGGFKITHDKNKLTLPVGTTATIKEDTLII